MSATNRRRGPNPDAEFIVIGAIIGGGFLVCSILWVGAWAATRDSSHESPGFPVNMAIGLFTGSYSWPGKEATAISAVCGGALLAIIAVIAFQTGKWKRRSPRIDRAIPYLAGPRDLRPSTTRGVTQTANRLGLEGIATPGILIGQTVRHRASLWGSWEDMHVDIWGPRTGKTACRAIPNIVAAPGAVVVTSNKRDVVDATRGLRAERGRVWVFDPQSQAGEPPSWYWDPLEFVGDSLNRAVKLASRMASVNRSAHTRSDAYFEPAAEDLLANLFLAASVDGRPITDVYRWLTRPDDVTPERILRAGGHILSADAVDGLTTAPDRQRAGVYGVAIQMSSFLTAPNVTEWVTPGSNPQRPRFRYKEFVADATDTIYLLSEETNKMAAPLVMAFTAALAEEAENQGLAGPGGRLPIPMLFVLDEAANVCPWKALPDKYSHFGSRGIVMMTILQSWAQGVAAWGDVGMSKLWGAANVRVYGGGVLDTKFLGDLSAASGIFEPGTTTMSRKSTDFFERNITSGSRSEPVLDVPDLASMPRGRAFVQISGCRPVLVRTVPWWEGPHTVGITASLDAHEPRTK